MRCCGASSSFVVGTPKEEETPMKPAIQSDVMTRINVENVHEYENEIPDAESENVKISDATKESTDQIETENIANFHSKERLNGETDEEAAESESVAKTADSEFLQEHQSVADEQSESVVQPDVSSKSHRQPKNLDDDVVMVYPNIMSGVPKTTPRNMPETNEMMMFDQEVGMDLHLVFSKTTSQPEPSTEDPTSLSVDPTTKKPSFKFAKRRRQYRPIQKPTTETSVEEMEVKPTTLRSRTVLERKSKLRDSTSTPSTEEPTISTTEQLQADLITKPTITRQEEVLVTSEDDKSQKSRFRLFNARHRLNYLHRTTTAATTESSDETTTSQPKTLIKKRPSNANENPSVSSPLDKFRIRRPFRTNATSVHEANHLDKIKPVLTETEEAEPAKPLRLANRLRINRRPLKMNETVIKTIDTNHRNMISKVRLALQAASTENKIREIPRSFASVEMSNRVKKIEKMLVDQMINVYAETKAKRRGDQVRRKETKIVQDKNTAQESPISKQTSNFTTPFRGNKKFQISDLLDKTPVVPMSVNEFRRSMRVRSTTPRPVEQVTDDDVVTTTRRPLRRRLTTTIPQTEEQKKTNIREESSSENRERSFRRRISIRRRLNADLSSSTTTTVSPPVQTTSEIVLTSSTIPMTISTEEAATVEDTTPTTESISISSESKNTEHETDEVDEDDESLQTVDVEENESQEIPTPITTNADLSNFKPSPLWSISTDEKNDFVNEEQNHSYDMDENEREQVLRKGHRRSRNAFNPPPQHLNGFTPSLSIEVIGPIPKSSKSDDDAQDRYHLFRDSKTQISKN